MAFLLRSYTLCYYSCDVGSLLLWYIMFDVIRHTSYVIIQKLCVETVLVQDPVAQTVADLSFHPSQLTHACPPCSVPCVLLISFDVYSFRLLFIILVEIHHDR